MPFYAYFASNLTVLHPIMLSNRQNYTTKSCKFFSKASIAPKSSRFFHPSPPSPPKTQITTIFVSQIALFHKPPHPTRANQLPKYSCGNPCETSTRLLTQIHQIYPIRLSNRFRPSISLIIMSNALAHTRLSPVGSRLRVHVLSGRTCICAFCERPAGRIAIRPTDNTAHNLCDFCERRAGMRPKTYPPDSDKRDYLGSQPILGSSMRRIRRMIWRLRLRM